MFSRDKLEGAFVPWKHPTHSVSSKERDGRVGPSHLFAKEEEIKDWGYELSIVDF